MPGDGYLYEEIRIGDDHVSVEVVSREDGRAALQLTGLAKPTAVVYLTAQACRELAYVFNAAADKLEGFRL